MKFEKLFPVSLFAVLALLILFSVLRRQALMDFEDHPAVAKFTTENFEAEVLQSEEPVLVDFWAEWCTPCLVMAPTISEIAQEYDGSAVVGKLHVDQNPEIVEKYNLPGIPYFAVFNHGKIVESQSGPASKATLVRMLEKHLTDTE